MNENDILGFDKKRINYIVNSEDRSGWLFQQLLRLGADKIVKNNDYLVLDSDTCFLNPITFIDKNENYNFYMTDEYHLPYFKAIKRLFKNINFLRISFTSHNIIMNKKVLKELKYEIENNTDKVWFNAIISLASPVEACCYSEYDCYGHYFTSRYSNYNLIPFYNISTSRNEINDINSLKKFYKSAYLTLSMHSYTRENHIF